MAHADTLSPSSVLMGMEAKSRADFEQSLAAWKHTDRLPTWWTQDACEADGLRFIVTYHPDRSWGYEFTAAEGGLRGKFDSRDSMLVALDWHMAVEA